MWFGRESRKWAGIHVAGTAHIAENVANLFIRASIIWPSVAYQHLCSIPPVGSFFIYKLDMATQAVG